MTAPVEALSDQTKCSKWSLHVETNTLAGVGIVCVYLHLIPPSLVDIELEMVTLAVHTINDIHGQLMIFMPDVAVHYDIPKGVKQLLFSSRNF